MATTKRNTYEDLINYARNFRPTFIEFLPVYSGEEDDKEEKPKSVQINPLEPQTFADFVGQDQAKEVLKIIVDAANKEKRLIPNILITGAYGHGKTTLAKLVAKRHKKDVQVIDGSVAGIVIKPDPKKIYIVDEAHNIPAQSTDSFNILIDAGELRIIACTTNPGALPAPFRSRFRTIYLEEYQPKDIAKIVERAAKRLKTSVDKEALNIIANRSKCNPRTALSILDFVRELAVMTKKAEITSEVVMAAIQKLSINEVGLTNLDRKYLDILKYDRPVGLQYIASTLSLDADTVQEEIEPYLLRLGYIERTPRGRIRVNPEGPAPPKRVSLQITPDLEEKLRQSLELL